MALNMNKHTKIIANNIYQLLGKENGFFLYPRSIQTYLINPRGKFKG